MRALQGLLPIDTEYSVLSYDHAEPESGCQCQNCGLYIVNTAEIRSLDGKRYIVGQDCAEGLVKGASASYKLQQLRKEYNRKRSLINKIVKAKKTNSVTIDDLAVTFYGNDGIWTVKYPRAYVNKIAQEFTYTL